MKKRLILKASAGTGKTYRLSLEYVSALCRGTDFKDILVMTFTKKATAEIKERILKFFSILVSNDAEKREELEKNILSLYPDIKFNREDLTLTYNNLIENKDKLKIYTIDAFTNLIFKRAIAPYLKIYSYEMVDSEENKKILIKTFQKLFENREDFKIFKGFLEDNSEKDMEKYLNLIKTILEERWKVILLGDKLKERRERFPVTTNFQYFDQIKELLEKIAQIKGKSLEEMYKTAIKNYLDISDNEKKEKFILNNHKVILADVVWNKTNTKSNKSKKINVDSEVQELEYIYGELKRNLAYTLFNDLIIPYEEKLLYTFERIYQVYDDIKFKEKKFTFGDISSYTFKYIREPELNLIDENGVTEDFFEILDGKFDTIFIDEFQDTSILQWKILKDIIDQTENVICVGDEKQSIYGWRGGEKKLFENLEEILNGTPDNLDTCFRSEENVVTFCNYIFENIFEITEGEWSFTKVLSKSSDGRGHIEILKKTEENSVIDEVIEKIKKDFNGRYKGIGILARTNKNLNFIGEKLIEADIPFVVETNSNISETRGIKGVFFLISWLVKDDYLALLDFLRSDLVNIRAKTIKHLIKNRESVESWFNSEESSLSLEERDQDILTILKDIRDEYILANGETSFLTYDILKKVGITKRFNTKGDISNLYSFYKILKSYKYFEEFLMDFEEQKNSDKFKKMALEDENSVTLMTIHKSKGLEFDTLFYYYLPSKKNNSNPQMKFFFTMDNKYEVAKDFLIAHDNFSTILKALDDEFGYITQEEEKEKQEEINNLYVALTRPKNNLYIAIEKEEKEEEKNPITKLLYSLNDKIPSGDIIPTPLSDEKEEKKREEFQLNLSTPIAQFPTAEESIGNDLEKIHSHSLANESKRIRGSAVHFFLENIIYGSSEEIILAKELTFSKYASTIGEIGIKELLSPQTIEYLLNKNPKLFSKEWDKIYTEYEVYDEDKTFRIDRLMIKDAIFDENENLIKKGVIYIADYKTGDTDEEQIENYKNILSDFLERQNKKEFYEIVTEFIEYKL